MPFSPPIPAAPLKEPQYNQGDQPDRLGGEGIAVDDDGKTRDLPAPDPIHSVVAWGTGQAGDKPSTATTPIQIGRCTLRRVIASGGMGTVYEAMQDEPRRIVALKVMRLGVASPNALERFKREAQVLARLRHPCIAQVYEAGMYHDGLGEAPYFIMEYIPNALPITEYAKAHKLDVRQRLACFIHVCEAVHHGHLNGVVHRDLKPSNILVDSHGQIKVIDFGVARATDSDMAVTTLQTDVGQLVGTLQYMSPEQAKADPTEVDVRSDVYSLGVVLYQLLTDRLPYVIKDRMVFEAVRTIQEQLPTRLSSINSHLRGDLETIVGKALAKGREQRYQSADELRQELFRYLKDEPIVARPPTISYLLRTRARAFASRHPLVCIGLAIAIAFAFAEFLAVPVVYRWTWSNEAYTQFVGRYFTPAIETKSFEHVIVISLDDVTVVTLNAESEAAGRGSISRESPRGIRWFHEKLMTRLSDCDVRVVAFDMTFAKEPSKDDPERGELESRYDEAFVRGVTSLTDKKIDVVIGTKVWPLGEAKPAITASIFRAVEWGGISAGFGELAWPVDLIVKRGAGEPVSSLSLAAAASYLSPGNDFSIEWPPPNVSFALNYHTIDPSNPRLRTSTGRVDRFRLTAQEAFDQSRHGDGNKSLEPGDLIGFFEVVIPEDAALRSSTIEYQAALNMPIDDLRTRLEGKAVLIGYTFPDDDVYDHPSGRRINGVYGHAAAADALIQGRQTVRIERQGWSWGLMIGSAIVGAILVTRMHRRPGVLAILGIIFAALFVMVCGLLYQTTRIVFNPLIPLASFAACMVCIAVLNHARHLRHA